MLCSSQIHGAISKKYLYMYIAHYMRSAFGHLVPANDPSTRPSDKHTAYCAAERQSWASVGRLKTRSKFDTFGAASAVHLHCIKYNGEVLTVRWPMSVWCVWWSQSASQRSD